MQLSPVMIAFPASARFPNEVSSQDLPAPNALLFFLSHQDTYRRPLFSSREVFCGPDTDTRIADRVLALRTPAGSFDAVSYTHLSRQIKNPWNGRNLRNGRNGRLTLMPLRCYSPRA